MPNERRQFARALRQQPTRAEEILWAQLRGSRFHGAKFRRQVPFDRYVVDFYCHAAKLAVELDGHQHEWFAEYDAGRTEVMERMGVRVIRFANEEVCGDLDAVLRGFAPSCSCPSSETLGPLNPCPFPMGEGTAAVVIPQAALNQAA